MWTRFIARNWSKESYSSGQHSYKGINSIYTSLGNECLFFSKIFPLIKCKLAMAYFNMISYIYFLFCLIFTIHTFLCVSIMSASTCSNRCFLFFLVWRQNNSIEEIKRGTKIAVLSQLKLFFIIVRQGLKYVICFHMSSNGTRLFKCMPSCATKMKVHKSWDSRNFISHSGH